MISKFHCHRSPFGNIRIQNSSQSVDSYSSRRKTTVIIVAIKNNEEEEMKEKQNVTSQESKLGVEFARRDYLLMFPIR
jgi:hypothetical protein